MGHGVEAQRSGGQLAHRTWGRRDAGLAHFVWQDGAPQNRLRTRERLHGISPTQGGRRYCRGGGPAGRDTSWVQKLTDWRCRGGEVRRWARGLGGCGASRQGPGPSGRRLPWQEQRAGRSTWWGRRLGLTSRQFALGGGGHGRPAFAVLDRPASWPVGHGTWRDLSVAVTSLDLGGRSA